MAPLLSLLLLVGLLARLVAGSVHGNYSVQVLADAPAVYYPLNETAGGGGVYAADYSGNARHGAYNSSLLGTAGLYFRAPLTLYPALSMNQSSVGFTSTLVSFVHSRAQLADYASFSLEVWMAAIAAQSAQLVSLGGSAAASTQTDAAVSIASSGSVTCACNVSHALTAVTAVAHTPFDGKPHHIVCTYNASSSELALYIDGQLSSNRTAGPRTVAGPLFLRVGGDQYRSQGFFSGVLGSVALYNRSLSSARLLSHYQTAVNGSSSLNYSSLFAPPRSLPVSTLGLIQYPNPPVPAGSTFSVSANGSSLHVYSLPTPTTDGVIGTGLNFTGCSFAFTRPLLLNVTWRAGSIVSWQINPVSNGLNASSSRSGNSLLIPLHAPAKFEVAINSIVEDVYDTAQLLYVFADGPEVDAPLPSDPSVYYFPAGYNGTFNNNSLFTIAAGDLHRGIYIAPGAQLRAMLALSPVSALTPPFRVWGRGFLFNPQLTKTNNAIDLFSTNISIDSIHLYGSLNKLLGFKAANVPGVTVVNNVKLLSSATNTDALTYCGPANGVIVNDSFILSNDNQIVLGGCGGAEPVGPYNNLIAASTFIKFNHAGNWLFLQGDNNGNGGEIGANNTITNCDIVRMDRELGLIVQTYGYPRGINNVTLDRLRLWSYNDTTQQTAGGSLLLLNTTDQLAHRSLTLSNFDIPTVLPSFVTNGNWQLYFVNMTVRKQPLVSNSQLNLHIVAPSYTTFSRAAPASVFTLHALSPPAPPTAALLEARR